MIKYRKELDLAEYTAISTAMADLFFDESGEYRPQYGILHAMRVFYNVCVTESPYDAHQHDIFFLLDLEEIVKDEEFIDAFNDAIANDGKQRISFGCAYKNAMDIVNYRISTLGGAMRILSKVAGKTIDSISELVSEENMNYLSTIAKEITSGKISADSIVDAYGKSKTFKQTVASDVNR